MGYVDLLSSDYRVVLTEYREKFDTDIVPKIRDMADYGKQRHAVINVFNFVAASIWIILSRGLIREKTEGMTRYETYVHDREATETLDVSHALEITRTAIDELIGLLPTMTPPQTLPIDTMTDSEYRTASLSEFRYYRDTDLVDLSRFHLGPDNRDCLISKSRNSFFSVVYTRVNLLIQRGLLPDTFQYFEDYMERDRDWHESPTQEDIAMIDAVIDRVIAMLLQSSLEYPVS